jgi:hypothetical protein
MTKTMTLAEIKASEKTMLVPEEVRTVLGCDAHSIRLQAREYPEQMGFPVVVIGNRTLIPRKPFLAFLGEGEEAAE